MRPFEAIRRANQPGPPENSIRLRAACTGTVLVSLMAARAQGEMALTTELLSGALIVVGMVFSYRTRVRPPAWIKAIVAVAATTALVWFVGQLSGGPITDITTVENPLTVLFAAILVVHSFHVPTRRDLMFALGASGALMAIAAAQAIDLRFAWYALGWIAFSLWALLEMWSSASGGGRVSIAGVGTVIGAVSIVAALTFLVLPAPVVSMRVDFASRAGSGGPVGLAGARAGDAGSPSQLSRPGSRQGPTRVGGYLGFADSLDTALRGSLSHQVVMRVRADRPSYWVGETFDSWDGQSWSSTIKGSLPLSSGSPFTVPGAPSDNSGGSSDLQTFYVVTSTADLIFHADSARQVWFPANALYYSNDGSIVSPIGLGRGAIYTVQSLVSAPTPAELRQASAGSELPSDDESLYAELPHPYPQAQALAQAVTAGAANTYDRVEALISWIGAHTKYSTDIPPLPNGADTVDEFLFGNRVGFCEQISTSLAVMLRTLGIPAREAVGYVPGPYNPVTDIYDVRADDAHAWVQVWFPGYGWQSFDPTAVVPLANPAPGTTALKDVAAALSHVPPLPVSLAAAVAGVVSAAWRLRRHRRPTWAEKLARRIERAGRRSGRPRHSGETLGEYADVLDGVAVNGSDHWRRLASAAEASAYGDRHPSPDDQRALLASAQARRAVRSKV